ncbi:hypothetical protein SUGI_0704950 [Cryptomeria japonica]|nr:hypothetical protein SUGI_0704950 [Cryptomeria japonica]
MGNFFCRVIRRIRSPHARRELETQQQSVVQMQTETSIFSSTDTDPPGLWHFDCELNIPLENPLPIRLRFYAFPDLQLDNNSLCRILDRFARRLNHRHLQALPQESDDHLVFLMVTNEHLQHSELTDFVIATNARGLFLVSSPDDESNHHGRQSMPELPAGIREINHEVEIPGGLFFKFRIFRLNDGTISDLEIGHIVSENLMQPQNFAIFEDAMEEAGEICFLVGTRNQLRNPTVINFLQRMCSFHMNLRIFLYEGQLSETPAISDEEAAEILGSPSFWFKGLDGIEIDCAICLDSIEEGDEVKVLACNHVYHYTCILRSTTLNRTCPICRAHYDYRQGQSK